MLTVAIIAVAWGAAAAGVHLAVILAEGNMPLWDKGPRGLRVLRHLELILLAPVETLRRITHHMRGIWREIKGGTR